MVAGGLLTFCTFPTRLLKSNHFAESCLQFSPRLLLWPFAYGAQLHVLLTEVLGDRIPKLIPGINTVACTLRVVWWFLLLAHSGYRWRSHSSVHGALGWEGS